MEKCPDTLILGNDHPFNPHLALRSFLDADDLLLVDQGFIPMEAILAAKKKVSEKQIANDFRFYTIRGLG